MSWRTKSAAPRKQTRKLIHSTCAIHMHRRDLSVASTQAYSYHHSVTTSVSRGNRKKVFLQETTFLEQNWLQNAHFRSVEKLCKEIVIIPKAIETRTQISKVLANDETNIPFKGMQYLLMQEQLTPPEPIGSFSSLSVVPGGHFRNICRQRSIQLATPPGIQMQRDEQSLVMNEELTGWASPLITQLVSPTNEKKKKKAFRGDFAGTKSKGTLIWILGLIMSFRWKCQTSPFELVLWGKLLPITAMWKIDKLITGKQ